MLIELTLKTCDEEKILFNVKHIVAIAAWIQYDGKIIGSAVHVSNDVTPFHVNESYEYIISLLNSPPSISNKIPKEV